MSQPHVLIPLFDEFKEWCKQNLTAGGSASDYPSRLKKITREFINSIGTGTKKAPFEQLEGYLKRTKNGNGPKIKLISELLTAIRTRINEELETRKQLSNVGSFGSERTAFNKYALFLSDKVASEPYRTTGITPSEDAVIQHISGGKILLEQDDLIGIFTSRIGTQDRITGDKLFLPLGLLSKICPKGVVREWANEQANGVLIHVENSSIAVSDVKSLRIDTTTSIVKIVRKEENEEQLVYDPPFNCQKVPMKISMISNTDIDHIADIHDILQKLKGSMPALDMITNAIIAKQKALDLPHIDSKNIDRIYSSLMSDTDFITSVQELVDLIPDELKIIANEIRLQLTSSNWNRSVKKQTKKNQSIINQSNSNQMLVNYPKDTKCACCGKPLTGVSNYNYHSCFNAQNSTLFNAYFCDECFEKHIRCPHCNQRIYKAQSKGLIY